MGTKILLIIKQLIRTFLLFSLLRICFPNCLAVCHHDDETESPAPSSPPLIPALLTFADQRLAVVYPIIQTFKNVITSDPFGITKTWVGSDVCNYTGFYCDNPPDNLTATTVASIDFNGYQLAAPTLDGFIDQLPDLALFHANTNKFSGIISSKIKRLRYLYELDLSNNNFLGHFPTALLTMPGLSFLDLRFNSFTGIVAPMIFAETLDALFLNNNNFVQILPETLGSTTATFLVLANNKFTGPIPRSIGNASETLTEVLFFNNVLTGCIPYELGLLRKLLLFDAGNNLLTGPLPCSLRCLENIEILNFAGNLLYGTVPEVVCELGNLVNFSLADNYFTYVGHQCRKRIKDGVLDVRNNCIRGLPDQRSAEECALFFLKPRSCLHPSWFTIIPCAVHAPMNRTSPKRYSRRKLVSYAALSRHRRLGDYVL